MESNCTPNSLLTFNPLAILPSRRSKIAENKTKMEASSKNPLILQVIERTPHNKFPIVNILGTAFATRLNKLIPPDVNASAHLISIFLCILPLVLNDILHFNEILFY